LGVVTEKKKEKKYIKKRRIGDAHRDPQTII